MALTGSKVIARTLKALNVDVVFGLVGLPVVDLSEEIRAHGIRFVAFRNEQAASYAASTYGYLTGRPGVLLVVGGPGVLHAIAGIGNASENAWPLLVLAGSQNSYDIQKGAFQELDQVAYLKPHTKLAVRPANPAGFASSVVNAYRTAFYGRPGPTFVDCPANLISKVVKGQEKMERELANIEEIPLPPKTAGDPARIKALAKLLKGAKQPLVVIGKGAGYARAEEVVRKLIDSTGIPFLPTPMGKGVVPDSHPLNISAARSKALSSSDVILVLGARLNWILSYALPPKVPSTAKIIQVDISAEEIGKNSGSTSLGILGDINLVISQLLQELGPSWKFGGGADAFAAVMKKNNDMALMNAKARNPVMGYYDTFDVIKSTLDRLSPPENGDIVYVSEGSSTMDISRSILPLEKPRQKLDAATYATMGIGLAHTIAAHVAYEGTGKKIIAIEGDSAIGFSLAEIETLVRYQMGAVIYVINNGGISSGASQAQFAVEGGRALPTTALGFEVRYDVVAQGLGAKGHLVRTPEELARATEEGFKSMAVPTVINVLIDPGASNKSANNWLATTLLGQKMALETAKSKL